MVLIYHGCFTNNVDGTNKLIGPREKCLIPTAQCFWKEPKDVHSGVKTSSQLKNQPTVSIEDYRHYFQKRNVYIDGFLAQRTLLRENQTSSFLVNFCCYGLLYR